MKKKLITVGIVATGLLAPISAIADVTVYGQLHYSIDSIDLNGGVGGFVPGSEVEEWEEGSTSSESEGKDVSDYVGSPLSMGSKLASLSLHGSHHLPLLRQNALKGGNCFWANGDIGNSTRGRDAHMSLVEFGGCYDFVPDRLRGGLGIGVSSTKEELLLGGDAKLHGKYLVAELDYKIPDTSLITSVTALAGRWDATIDRGYFNGVSLDQSRGKTDVDVASIRMRIDWLDAFQYSDISITPHAEYTHTYTSKDSYTETGGAFPMAFNSQSHISRELRLGFSCENRLSAATYLRGTLEAVHRFDNEGPSLTAKYMGLGYTSQGEDIHQNWLRVGIELEHKVSSNAMISLSVNASSEGQDPDFSGGLSLKSAF